MNDEADPPDPEVPERAKRRRFTAEYKAMMLAKHESASPAERGEQLRREGLSTARICGVAQGRGPRRGRGAGRQEAWPAGP